jgi:hypothetical protein
VFLPGSGMGTLQQLLNKDNTHFDEMTAHQVYSFIQLVKAFPRLGVPVLRTGAARLIGAHRTGVTLT